MSTHYRHRDEADRFTIDSLLSIGHTQLRRQYPGSQLSTISREVKRARTIGFARYIAALGRRVRVRRRRRAGPLCRKLGDDKTPFEMFSDFKLKPAPVLHVKLETATRYTAAG